MDLKSLKYFIAVYENMSFSAAAKHCYIAQPSISSAVAQLESLLSTTLFTRHARGVKPTADGEKLYPLAKKLIGQAGAITASFKETPEKPEFRLGVTRGLGVQRMSALLKDFTSTVPNMALTLVPPNAESDARIITKEELALNESYLPLWQEDYLLALPYDHPLSLKSSLSLTDFHQLAMIKRSPCQAWQQLEEVLALAGTALDIRAQIRTIDYALGLVSAGVGCAILPAYKEVLAHKDIIFRPIEELQLRREIILAYHVENDIFQQLKHLVNVHK
ncbi:LysR family transcriptional regulator [Thalassotalea sp. M1531]|uniref:LysR family transcriptional regulator n=1 Tax=Thalassotalea algicola TaxID=2716224 RepID=A0A7Y0L923_9GAMM|nr:LysR family transcriptional regulator [Thalassotalea algicola]NMP30195.1 LysR family transcriptional regulator [Thalassotalea algicola]